MTTIRGEFRYSAIDIEHVWIELSDGTKLSARLRLPEIDRPVPAVLEYLPYRKNDGTLARDNRQHAYLAGHGFACVRVDIRGSGDSDGILHGEYLEAELADGVEVIAWIAAQPWCNGQVAMMGISWGGFNSLQIAALRPPALCAVVSVASTVDRYATDVHYKGGAVLGTDMLPWAATMLAFNARPLSRQAVPGEWCDRWIERVHETPPFIEDWLAHQHRDDFWQHGSVCEDFSAISCPVLSIGGFADGYTDTVFHLVEHLNTPVRGIVGPWSHNYPAVGVPGPNIGFLQEVVDFLGTYTDAPVVEELSRQAWTEPLRIWVQGFVDPGAHNAARPGRWIAEPGWPSPNVTAEPRYLAAEGLVASAPTASAVVGSNEVTVGLRQGGWWGYAQPGQLPGNQQLEDASAFCFEATPAASPTTIVGMPQLFLDISVDQPIAQVAARLCDVAPDGTALQISRGVLNLTHRDGHEQPAAVVPGERYLVCVELDGVAHDLAAGHRLQLQVGTSLWPIAWPAPAPCELRLHLGAETRLDLPIHDPASRQTPEEDGPTEPWFLPPETADPRAVEVQAAVHRRTLEEDLRIGEVVLTDYGDEGRVRFVDSGATMASTATDTWAITRGDPMSARVKCERTWEIDQDGRVCAVAAESEMWCDADFFYTSSNVRITDDGVEIASRDSQAQHPRDLV